MEGVAEYHGRSSMEVVPWKEWRKGGSKENFLQTKRKA